MQKDNFIEGQKVFCRGWWNTKNKPVGKWIKHNMGAAVVIKRLPDGTDDFGDPCEWYLLLKNGEKVEYPNSHLYDLVENAKQMGMHIANSKEFEGQKGFSAEAKGKLLSIIAESEAFVASPQTIQRETWWNRFVNTWIK